MPVLIPIRESALAGRSSPGGTVRGSSAADAGIETAAAAPCTTLRTSSAPIGARSVSTASPTPVCTSAADAAAPWSTSARGSRSASSPPKSSSSTLLTDRAPTTSPTSTAEPPRSQHGESEHDGRHGVAEEGQGPAQRERAEGAVTQDPAEHVAVGARGGGEGHARECAAHGANRQTFLWGWSVRRCPRTAGSAWPAENAGRPGVRVRGRGTAAGTGPRTATGGTRTPHRDRDRSRSAPVPMSVLRHFSSSGTPAAEGG